MIHIGLRGKSLIAVFAVCLFASFLAAVIGWQALETIGDNLGSAYARNFTLLSKQRVVAPIGRELALSTRLADSELLRQWFLDEDNLAKRDAFFKEARGFQRDFEAHSYFAISSISNRYYLNDAKQAFTASPRFTLSPTEAKDSWFFKTMVDTNLHNLNVNVDLRLKVTNVWINVVVRDGDRKIGLAGTGLDLSNFITDFVSRAETGVVPIIVDRDGQIQAHPNAELIAFGSGSKTADSNKTLFKLISENDAFRTRALLDKATAKPDQVFTEWVTIDKSRRLLAVSFDPTLNWHFLTLLDLKTAQVFDPQIILPIAIGAGVLLLLLGASFVYGINRIVLNPLLALTHSARQVADGNYAIELPPPSADEIGQMTSAFGKMVDQIKSHALSLEEKIATRTHDLSEANLTLAQANKHINDSIEYASLIQRSILPNEALSRALPDAHFALWLPREVVGGDFHLFRDSPEGFIIGIADCAGHGVPGACMTMLAHAIIDHCIDQNEMRDPAAIIKSVDSQLRNAIAEINAVGKIASNMDLALAYINRTTRQLTFCGAKISLYVARNGQVTEIKGGRRPLGERRCVETETHTIAIDERDTIYLASDGYLDQSGGSHGFGFGNRRFTDLLASVESNPIDSQCEALLNAVKKYQGQHLQRDDITVVGFRLPIQLKKSPHNTDHEKEETYS